MDVHISFRQQQHVLHVPQDASLGILAGLIVQQLDVSQETVKLLRKGKLIKPSEQADTPLAAAGITPGTKMTLMASPAKEVQQLQSAKELPGMMSFQQELQRAASRQRSASAMALKLPTGPYTFGTYEAWQLPGLRPPPNQALKLLHRLAADPGIVGIMRKHSWAVGKLSEMAPEGKVGISPVCVLGVNINKGQEISLRLRTDDLKGFRRYDRILETLLHELAHMVHGDHDHHFKALNSQLNAEHRQLDWTRHGHAPAPGEFAPDHDDEAAHAAAPAARLLGSSTGLRPASARAAAAEAAASRAAAAAAAQQAGQVSAGPAAAVPVHPGDDIEGLGHRDDRTEAAEEAARRLSSSRSGNAA